MKLCEASADTTAAALTPFQTDSQGPTPPGGGEGGGGVAERAEGGQGGQPVVRELWFIVVMTAVALLLLAVALGALLHKVNRRILTVRWLSFHLKNFFHVPPCRRP